jgi:hypothetical protein
MFGQHQQDQNDNQIPEQSIDGALGAGSEDAPSGSPWQHPGQPLDDQNGPSQMASTGMTIQPPSDDNSADAEDTAQSPAQDATPPTDDGAAPVDDATPPAEDAVQEETPEPQAEAPVVVTPDAEEPVVADTNDLLDIKQQALTQLSPLVDHLEQAPEERFRTTMMMIQASDNQALVRTAFDAAQAIPDEKARAQALLDVINEINYFTQHQTPQQ